MLLANQDENKVFNIIFGRHRLTVPVLHIFWNTVFCADPGNSY